MTNKSVLPVKRAASLGRALLVVALIVGLLTLGASSVYAAAPAPVTLHESVVFGCCQPPVGDFTAAGLPGCDSGTLTDRLNQLNLGGHRLVVDRSYSCAGGTGSFTARMVLEIQPVDADGNQVIGGQWTILRTAGALAGVQGTGTTTGLSSGCSPVGSLFAVCQTGISTVTAEIQ